MLKVTFCPSFCTEFYGHSKFFRPFRWQSCDALVHKAETNKKYTMAHVISILFRI